MTKFVVLQPIKRETAEEVVNQLFDIFVFLVPLAFYRATTVGFRNVDLTRMMWELWPGCGIVHGKPRHPQLKVEW